VPTRKQLHPAPVASYQEHFKPSNEQLRNARAIVKASQKMHLPPRATVIAMATAMQEIHPAQHRRPRCGTTTTTRRACSSSARPRAGARRSRSPTPVRHHRVPQGLINVDGWKTMELTDAAQAVQVSAFPDHYAKWENEAGDLVRAFYGAGPYAHQAATL
jgi:hypothetical protein